jgi:hypothetical protein
MRRGVGTWLLGIGLLLLTGFCLWTLAEPRETRPAMVELWVPPAGSPDSAPVPPSPAPAEAAAPPPAAGPSALPPAAPAPPPAPVVPKPVAAVPPPAAPPPAKLPPAAAVPAPPRQVTPALSPAELAAARRNVDALMHKLSAPPAQRKETAGGGFADVLRSVESLKREQLASVGEVDPAPPPPPADLVRRQLLPCWERRAGPRGQGAPAVQIRLQLDGDGRIIRAETVDRSRLDDPVYRAVATSAVRAILECQPVKPPPGPLASWAVMTLTFVP